MLLKCCAKRRLLQLLRLYGTSNSEIISLNLSKYLEIPINNAKRLVLRTPILKNINESKIVEIIDVIQKLGYQKSCLAEYPGLFYHYPITLEQRFQILEECGCKEVTPKNLMSYLFIVRNQTIQVLKTRDIIDKAVNIERHLSSYLTEWPTTSFHHHQRIDECINSLNEARFFILQRYLELVLDLNESEFKGSIKKYYRNKSFRSIQSSLNILRTHLNLPLDKIKANLYLLYINPENLKLILQRIEKLGGISIKEVLRANPKICCTNYKAIVEIEEIIKGFGISDEAQSRCLSIYTLKPETVKQRIETAFSIPEFHALFNHPRFLRLIYSNNTALQRISSSHKINKRCISLNIMSASTAHFKSFEAKPGDWSKGKDLVLGLAKEFEDYCTRKEIHRMIKRHPFWTNVPLAKAKFNLNALMKHFSKEDILNNIQLLMYDIKKVDLFLKFIENNDMPWTYSEQLDQTKLNKGQILSLILYFLEKEHHFSGGGIWAEEKNTYEDHCDEKFVLSTKNAV